ncbi:unnamed protein product [Protopolystoma xenopodis]|uniref:Uncharacterized protein n=1 Tax=Protopolystoma xenopodis TaxID=117903 RepID=A0A448X281_9PLAT|nr:unnamed protein product [Protopolystoma xenopodis]
MGTFHTFKWVLIIWSSSLVLTGLILLSSSAFIVHQAGFHKYQRLFTLLLMLSTRDQSLELLLKVITTNLYPLVANWKEEDIKMDDLLSSQDDTGLLASQATGYLLAYLFCSVIRTWHIVAIILIFASLILIGTTSIIATYLQGRRLLLVSSGALIALLIGVSFAHNLVMDWQPMAHLSLVEFLMVKVSKEFQLQPSSFPDVIISAVIVSLVLILIFYLAIFPSILANSFSSSSSGTGKFAARAKA